MENMTEEALMNIMKVYIAQMNSAMKISKIICEHENSEELTGDHVISGLVYRLMNTMSKEDMEESLEKAHSIMNDESSDDDEEEEEEEIVINNASKEWRKIKTNNCECNICSRVRICLQGYESYETYDPMVTRFKDSIKTTCKTHKIII